jgi:ubiquinone/menaquinone biosynthesis C-methylase UbiE
MAGLGAPAAFDRISEVYDETREPLEATVVEGLAGHLRAWGVHSLLEVGVGTGRVALPMRAQGFEVTGLDASRGMLARARSKGVRRLVRGSAYRLPVADHAVDAALFVHVLHLLEDPAAALTEGCRATRIGVVGLVRPGSTAASPPEPELRPRRLVIEMLRKDGVPIPDRAGGGPPIAERRLLAEHPPDRLETLSDEEVTEPLADELTMFEKRASRWTLDVPPEAMARAVAAVRAIVGSRTRTYRRVLAVALWERAPAPTPAAVARGTDPPRHDPG